MIAEVPARTLDFHGVGIEVRAADPRLGEAIEPRLAAQPEPTAPSWRPDLVFTLGGPRPSRLPPPSRTVYDAAAGAARYAPQVDALLVDVGRRARALARCADGHVWIWVRHGDPHSIWLGSHPLFTLPLVELLKRRGLFCVHAAAVAASSRAALIAGPSGAGKSTLAVALHLLGLKLLGDDLAFLRVEGGRLQVLSFPDEVDLTPASVGMLPGLAAPVHPRRAGWPKHQLSLAVPPASAEPAAVVFPRIQMAEPNRLTRLPASEALRRLVPNVLLTEPGSSKRHLDALGGLADRTPCHELTMGSDLRGAAELVAGLLS